MWEVLLTGVLALPNEHIALGTPLSEEDVSDENPPHDDFDSMIFEEIAEKLIANAISDKEKSSTENDQQDSSTRQLTDRDIIKAIKREQTENLWKFKKDGDKEETTNTMKRYHEWFNDPHRIKRGRNSVFGNQPDKRERNSVIGNPPDKRVKNPHIGYQPDKRGRNSVFGNPPDKRERRPGIGNPPDKRGRRPGIGNPPDKRGRRPGIGNPPDKRGRRPGIGNPPDKRGRNSVFGNCKLDGTDPECQQSKECTEFNDDKEDVCPRLALMGMCRGSYLPWTLKNCQTSCKLCSIENDAFVEES